jgi:hypothetical protein
LAFGQFGQMGPSLEALVASAAKWGVDGMAGQYLIENREAAVGVQIFHRSPKTADTARVGSARTR